MRKKERDRETERQRDREIERQRDRETEDREERKSVCVRNKMKESNNFCVCFY